MTSSLKENNLILTEKWEGLDTKLVPLAMKFDVVSGNSLEKTILFESGFNNYIDHVLSKELHAIDSYTEEYKLKLQEELDKLKQVIKESKIKITINIELEKYE